MARLKPSHKRSVSGFCSTPPPRNPGPAENQATNARFRVFGPNPLLCLAICEPPPPPPPLPYMRRPTTSLHHPRVPFLMVHPKPSPSGSVLVFRPKSPLVPSFFLSFSYYI